MLGGGGKRGRGAFTPENCSPQASYLGTVGGNPLHYTYELSLYGLPVSDGGPLKSIKEMGWVMAQKGGVKDHSLLFGAELRKAVDSRRYRVSMPFTSPLFADLVAPHVLRSDCPRCGAGPPATYQVILRDPTSWSGKSEAGDAKEGRQRCREG